MRHQFGGERRTAAALAAGAQCHKVDLCSQGGEVNMLLYRLQRITKLIQLGLVLLVGKQNGHGHENLRQVRGANMLPDSPRFLEVSLGSAWAAK